MKTWSTRAVLGLAIACGAFTWDFDGVTPFITIERANEITQFAFDQWNDVPTATFEAGIAGTIESRTGIADVTSANAAQFYEKQNGEGVWVLYDTDGAILEEYFGVSRYAVLGIAFPEWADENGRITEATALLNGSLVDAGDTDGNFVSGVFTHEFGHAINLSHAQINGPLVYSSYPTTPQMLVSQGEYWDAAESSDPAADRPCNATPIRAQAGVVRTANITFNGYARGVQFTPVVDAYLTDLAKNGRSAAGLFEQTVFIWDQSKGFEVLPPEIVANNSSMTRNGQWLTVNVDFDGDGISQAALRASNGTVTSLGDLNGDTCGGSSSTGLASSYGWAVDDTGRTAVGTAYIDRNGDGSCESPYLGEILPFIWTAGKGTRTLDTKKLPMDELPWVRAHAISGNGEVVLGTANFQYAYAWVKEGPAINLTERYGADPGAYAVSFDGHRVALNLVDRETYQGRGVALWDYARGLTPIGSLEWCKDVPYVSWFGGDQCEYMSGAEIEAIVGRPPLEIYDMSDDGSVLVGRSGSFFTGFVGALWIERVGWMTWDDFFRKQGVVEASNAAFSNPISISGTGREVVGGTAGASFSWLVNMSQVFVCERGQSIQTGFPNGLRAKIAAGARLGRCEHLQ